MKRIFVKLPSGYFAADHIREQYDYFKDTPFEYMKWKPRPALIEKNRKTSWLYTGQKFDPKYIDLVQDGWTHDHCTICYTNISDFGDQYHQTSGYFSGEDWICKSCYETFFITDDFEKRLSELPYYEE